LTKDHKPNDQFTPEQPEPAGSHKSMSSQKSDLPIRSNGDAALHAAVDDLRAEAKAHPGKIDLAEQKGFQTDPYASPAIYYGESHGPRKTNKTRTLSSVSQKHILAPATHTA
jgi:hypothetical protein